MKGIICGREYVSVSSANVKGEDLKYAKGWLVVDQDKDKIIAEGLKRPSDVESFIEEYKKSNKETGAFIVFADYGNYMPMIAHGTYY